MAPNSSLFLELYCRKGMGYVPEKKQQVFFEQQTAEGEQKFIIVLDSNYSPVKEVFPLGEKIVTGLMDQEEQLSLEITTNSSKTPKDALKEVLSLTTFLFEDIKKKCF